MRRFAATLFAMLIAVFLGAGGTAVAAGPSAFLQEHAVAGPGDALPYDLSGYTAGACPRAAMEGNTLLLTWRGAADADLRLRLGLDNAQPIVRELAVRRHGGECGTLGQNLRPDFHVTSGVRRVSYQQLNPLRDRGVEITQEVMDREQWHVFPRGRDQPRLRGNAKGFRRRFPGHAMGGTQRPLRRPLQHAVPEERLLHADARVGTAVRRG